ncbi:MAG: ATP-binding cassette domain-containing protein [Magnetovibrio sp.]|nr:ATP-binding cassette domain-containing protein [Magnetovibrio sp.]
MTLCVRNLKRLSLGPINFDVAAGDIVAVTGPSGAGKSLLLRAIADLDPNDGKLSLNGADRESMNGPTWRKKVMYVPAYSGWWADGVEPHFEGAQRAHVIDTLHHLGLESTALGWDVCNLSTGERQRLSFARAVVHAPQILMLDEPTSGLDADNGAKMEMLISQYAKDGMGIIFVTHDVGQAARLGTRCLSLKDGQLTEVQP